MGQARLAQNMRALAYPTWLTPLPILLQVELLQVSDKHAPHVVGSALPGGRLATHYYPAWQRARASVQDASMITPQVKRENRGLAVGNGIITVTHDTVPTEQTKVTAPSGTGERRADIDRIAGTT